MSRQHLLLVDADPQQQQLRAVGLRQAGFQVTPCAEGYDALQRARDLRPDLVLAEAALPGLDGLSLLAHLKADPATRDIPVVLLSDDGSVERRVEALERGVADFLPKPVFNKEIVARVRLLLQRKEQETLRQTGAADLSGSLGDMGLLDLVEGLQTRTATVSCTSPRGEPATFWVEAGAIVDAECGRLVGESAFHRLTTWADGHYHAHFGPHGRPLRIRLPTKELLLESLRRADEWGRTLEQLPGLDAVFEVDFVALAMRLGDIPDEANAVLRLLDGRRALRDVLELSPVDDLTTLQAVRRLFADGIVRASGAFHVPEPRRPQPAPPPAVEAVTQPALQTVAPPAEIVTPIELAPLAPESAPEPKVEPKPEPEPKFVGKSGKPLRGAALRKALEAEARRKHEAAPEKQDEQKDEPKSEPDVVVTVTQPAPTTEAVTEPAPVRERPTTEAVTEPAPVRERLAAEAPQEAAQDAIATAPQPSELAPAERACPTCASPMPEGVAFCGSCGARMAEAATASEAAITDPSLPIVPAEPIEIALPATTEEIQAPALASLLSGEGPAAPPTRDTADLIPVVRYAGHKGARRKRLEDQTKELKERARGDKSQLVTLPRETLAPGLVPSPDLLAKSDQALAPKSEPVQTAPEASKTEASPSKTEEAPSKTEEAPSKTEASPSKTEELSPKQQSAPSKTVETASDADEDEELAAYLRKSQRKLPVVPLALAVVVLAVVAAVFALRGEEAAKETKPAPIATAPAPAPTPAPAPAPEQPAELKPESIAATAPAEVQPAVAPATATVTTAAAVPAEKKPVAESAPTPAPNGPAAQPAAGEFDQLLAQGLKATAAEQWGRATSSLQKALKLKKDPIVLRELGKAYYNTDKLDRALDALREATQLNDKDAETYMFLGMALTDSDRKDEAKRAYRRFLFLEPKSSPRHREISAVLQNLERN